MNNTAVNVTTSEASFQPSEAVLRLQMCGHIINVLFVFPTNSYIIWLIITETGIASGFFNFNFSVCEIGISLNSLFALFSQYFQLSSLEALMYFLSGLGITGQPLFQCLICVERYLAVIHPVTFLKLKPLRYRLMCSAVAWIICFGSCFCCMFMLLSFYFIMYVWFFSVQYIVFLSIQLFCCVAVLRALKQSGPGERGREREEENNMKKRAFYLILITTVTMVVIYLPFTVAGFYYILSSQYIFVLYSLCYFLFILAGFIQPVFYLHWAGKLCCLCSK